MDHPKAARGSGNQPVAAVARKTFGGRARQAKEEQDKSGQVRTGHLTECGFVDPECILAARAIEQIKYRM